MIKINVSYGKLLARNFNVLLAVLRNNFVYQEAPATGPPKSSNDYAVTACDSR
jgi:hypothetical protein